MNPIQSLHRAMMLTAATAGLFVAMPAAANITYVSTRTLSDDVSTGCCAPVTVQLSLTTDGTLGAIGATNLLNWSITLTNAGGSALLDPTNSTFEQYYGGKLMATASDISFNFSSGSSVTDPNYSGTVLWRTDPTKPNYSYYCVQCQSDLTAREFGYINSQSSAAAQNQSGLTVLASVPAVAGVPEPATWGLMILGFGAIGGAMRARRPVRLARAGA